jgi:hypothetical protein
MPRKKIKRTEFDIVHMTEAQCKEIKEEIDSLEKMLSDPRPWVRNKITDEAEVKNQIRSKKELLNNHVPHKLRGPKANRAYAEAKKLADFIREQMPSRKDYFRPYAKESDDHNRQADFERAVQQQVAFQTNPDVQRAVIRYKAIMRRIDPSDPSISNIEKLRT